MTLADTHAKRAVEHQRVPYRIRNIIKAHDEATSQNAMWIARATVLASEQAIAPHRDTEASRERALAAARKRKKLKAMKPAVAPAPTAIDPQTGEPTQIRLRERGGTSLPR